MVDNERAEPDKDQQQRDTADETAPRQPAGGGDDESLDSPVELDESAPVDLGQLSRVADLEKQVAELKDQLLRAVAETENLRRRAERERSDAAKYAAVPLIKDLLAVADNLERALSSVPEEAKQGDGALSSLLTGVEMTERELQSVLQRHKIEKLDPMGQKMNPHEHEAMFEVPDANNEPGTVVQVIQQGYKLHDRLLRPARVGIARSDPQAAQAGGEAAGESATDGANDPSSGPGQRIDTSA